MPTLILRGLPAALVARLRAYADRYGLSERQAAERVLDAGLRAHERAVTGGRARAATMTPEERAHVSRAGGLARASASSASVPQSVVDAATAAGLDTSVRAIALPNEPDTATLDELSASPE